MVGGGERERGNIKKNDATITGSAIKEYTKSAI